MTDEELDDILAQLSTQQSMQTNALVAALEGRWAGGADTVDGWVKALDPLIVTDPKTPLYPPSVY